MEELRSHALEKMNSKKTYSATGLAMLYLHTTWINNDTKVTKDLNVNISLEDNLSSLMDLCYIELKTHIADDITESKFIHKGKFLHSDGSLSSQGVTNCGHIMVLIFTASNTDDRDGVENEAKLQNSVNETTKLVQALAKRKDAGRGKHDHYFLEINDQNGKRIELPDEEREALGVAMTLHEKGRNLLKSEHYEEGLLILLESSDQFK